MPSMARRVAGFGTTIFAEINRHAQQYGAVNLGQGAPDFDGPPPVLAGAVQALHNALNQYAPGWGLPQARQAVARHAARFYGQVVDPASEVLMTVGATEALFAAIMGLTDPGDEVIVFAPTYDSYLASLSMAGAVPRVVYLDPPGWTFDPAALAAAFTPRTRAIMVNTPHNPTGKMYSRAELEIIADLCRRHDVIAITDEVYEHIGFDGSAHTRLATLPGMAERTLTISSLGKTFSVTGWKVGWAIGPEALVGAVNRAHQFITYSVATPLQAAAASALDMADEYFAGVRNLFQGRRDYLLGVLKSAGFDVLVPQGGYFIMADWRPLVPDGVRDDVSFARWLIEKIGVACIPPSAFYVEGEKGRAAHLARFAVCKQDATLQAAAERLAVLAKRANGSLNEDNRHAAR